mgnify:CR=1 FL=1
MTAPTAPTAPRPEAGPDFTRRIRKVAGDLIDACVEEHGEGIAQLPAHESRCPFLRAMNELVVLCEAEEDRRLVPSSPPSGGAPVGSGERDYLAEHHSECALRRADNERDGIQSCDCAPATLYAALAASPPSGGTADTRDAETLCLCGHARREHVNVRYHEGKNAVECRYCDCALSVSDFASLRSPPAASAEREEMVKWLNAQRLIEWKSPPGAIPDFGIAMVRAHHAMLDRILAVVRGGSENE